MYYRITPRPRRTHYPSAAHRRSYARRTQRRTRLRHRRPANGTSRGWCRLTGLAQLMLTTTACLPSATSGSCKPGRPATRQPAPRRRRSRRKPAAVGERPSARSPPLPAAIAPAPSSRRRTTPRHGDQDGLPRIPATHSARSRPSAAHSIGTPRNVRPRCEDHQDPHVNKAPRNAKTSRWS